MSRINKFLTTMGVAFLFFTASKVYGKEIATTFSSTKTNQKVQKQQEGISLGEKTKENAFTSSSMENIVQDTLPKIRVLLIMPQSADEKDVVQRVNRGIKGLERSITNTGEYFGKDSIAGFTELKRLFNKSAEIYSDTTKPQLSHIVGIVKIPDEEIDTVALDTHIDRIFTSRDEYYQDIILDSLAVKYHQAVTIAVFTEQYVTHGTGVTFLGKLIGLTYNRTLTPPNIKTGAHEAGHGFLSLTHNNVYHFDEQGVQINGQQIASRNGYSLMHDGKKGRILSPKNAQDGYRNFLGNVAKQGPLTLSLETSQDTLHTGDTLTLQTTIPPTWKENYLQYAVTDENGDTLSSGPYPHHDTTLNIDIPMDEEGEHSYTASVHNPRTDESASSTATVVAEKSNATMEENIQTTKITISPNPAHNRFSLTIPAHIHTPCRITITNPQGQIIYTTMTTSHNPIIHIPGISSGIYILTASDNTGGQISTKISIIQ